MSKGELRSTELTSNELKCRVFYLKSVSSMDRLKMDFTFGQIPDDDDERGLIEVDGSCSSKSTPTTEEGSVDALIRDFGDFGTTPPRTRSRILRRNRSQKHKKSTLRQAYKFAQFCHKSIVKYSPVNKLTDGFLSGPGKGTIIETKKTKTSKRSFQKRRETERNIKFNLTSPNSHIIMDDGADSQPTIKVESSSRFLSLSCKLVKAAGHWRRTVVGSEYPKDRTKLYESVHQLIKTGTCESKDKNPKRQLSREETMWQTELKDLIWLELQAWHAVRTPSEQDQYLCEARQSIPQLLQEILDYRFVRKAEQLSVQSRDSGVHFPSPEADECDLEQEDALLCKETKNEESCGGCFWLFCPWCIEQENAALHQIEMLLSRLEFAESLYPSSVAFASQNPIYMSQRFNDRVKAMCSWYNITKHHRLKLLILGRQLLSYAQGNHAMESSSSSSDSLDLASELDSTLSSYWNTALSCDVYNIQPITTMGKYLLHLDKGYSRTYRKFIEDMLKVKGLKKALYFLDKIHFHILKKARLALELYTIEGTEESEEEFESRKYGLWSHEAEALNLPSYIPSFLFISRVPVDVIHEFLRMRLETKPENPSVLSIRQLIRELKEGLKLAVVNKERFLHHIDIALSREDVTTQNRFKECIIQFDECLVDVLNVYLSYIHEWVMMTQKEKIYNNLLEEEWSFIISTVSYFPKGGALAGRAFCKIASELLCTIRTDFLLQISCVTDGLTSHAPDSSRRQSVLMVNRSLQTLCQDCRVRAHRVLILAKMLNKHLKQDIFAMCPIVSESAGNLKTEALKLCESLKTSISLVDAATQATCNEDPESCTVVCRFRDVLHQLFKFGFECYREVYRLVDEESRTILLLDAVKFCQDWLRFVISYCEKGRGMKPRWAHYGLDFLMWVIGPENTNILSEEEFEALKLDVEKGVAHILGAATPAVALASPNTYMSTRARSSSPLPTPFAHKNSVSSQPDLNVMNGDVTPTTPGSPDSSKQFVTSRSRQGRLIRSINKLDEKLDAKRRNEERIGSIVATQLTERQLIKPRPVTFTWQRGIKIGQGRFGKVYTAVNNDTGELLAMKEISMLPNDVRMIRNVAQELKIIEGINHPHLVRYYGTEIHREELYIFMELCTEGTLESLVESTESGLPEALVRRYTGQLVSAIAALHQHAIVHRDIKTANIYLTAEGNCLKVGDFGSAVKIKAHTTVPGELKGFVGTQAYMAPEVFMKTNSEGHGRAADIWSLGCVVIEMASGKRPWHEYDSNYQIMFKVGMGEKPAEPESLSDEGKDLIESCLKHDPRQRPTASQLSHHNFLRVDVEDISVITSPILEDYLKLGLKP